MWVSPCLSSQAVNIVGSQETGLLSHRAELLLASEPAPWHPAPSSVHHPHRCSATRLASVMAAVKVCRGWKARGPSHGVEKE